MIIDYIQADTQTECKAVSVASNLGIKSNLTNYDRQIQNQHHGSRSGLIRVKIAYSTGKVWGLSSCLDPDDCKSARARDQEFTTLLINNLKDAQVWDFSSLRF